MMEVNKKILYVLFLLLILITFSIYLTEQNTIELFQNSNKLIKNQNMEEQIDMLTYSKFSPECCSSTYSSSSGCLCNKYDEKFAIESRGGNKLL